MSKTNVQPVEFSVAEAQPTGKPLLHSNDLSLIHSVTVQLATQIGSAELTVEQLYNLRQGDIVNLNSAVHDDINLMLNGNVVAQGKLVAVDGNFAVEITAMANW